MAGYKGWSGGEKVDWDKVDSGSPTPLDRGIYNAVVTKAEANETSNGKPAIMVELQVSEKYNSDDEVTRKLFDTFTMTKEGLFKAKQFCDATGTEPPESTTYGDVCDFAEDMVDVDVWALVGVRTFEGKARNRIEFYISDDDVAEVFEKENADPSVGGVRKRRGRSKDVEEKPSRRRRKVNGAAEAKSDDDDGGTEEIKDKKDEEEKPRRARRRRRSQAEQG